ncbi:MAG: TIR domain-containing protein [Clostridiales bacterium]|nr:TIR domain-containing protein [Clostridiales bacterium]
MVIKCKMCGGELNITDESNICECEFCGTQQTIPVIDNEKKVNLFNRANRLRMNAEFDKAATVYASITAEFPEEAEAYWGLCLCKYGIEYVDDPLTGNKIPTCHRTLTTSIMDDSDFDQACEYADPVAKRLYREEAKAIDILQQDILNIVASEEPFDVFICYKETDENGERTDDSVLAQDIYDFLTEKGLKVFFARITLEDKLGQQYEPYIYAALHSSRVMLAIGTKYEYFDAVWVKNEWARYLDMMKSDKSKTLIPCFKGIDAYDMPREFKNLQALDMGKIGWKQDLVHGIRKLTAKEEKPKQEIVQTVIGAGTNVDNLMKRVRLFLEDGDFSSAQDYVEKVLDENAEYAPAYVAKVCIAMKVRREEDLAESMILFDENPDWKKALRFADAQQRAVYEDYWISSIVKKVRSELMDDTTWEHCQEALRELKPYSGYEKAAMLMEQIREIANELKRREQEELDEQRRIAEEEDRQRKAVIEEEFRQHLIRLADAQKDIKRLKEEFEVRKREYENVYQIEERHKTRKREIERELDASRELAQALLAEELKATGRGLGKKRNYVAEQRRQEEETQDSLRRKLAEEEKRYLSERSDNELNRPREDQLTYAIAGTYYDHELYMEALDEYNRIPDYRDVRQKLAGDPNLKEAARKKKQQK